MGRRIAVALAVAAVLPVLLFAIFSARILGQSNAESIERRLTGVSQAYARTLRSRVGAAESLVQNLAARDVGYDGSLLRQQIVNSRAFKGAVVVDRDGGLAAGGFKPTPAQLIALEAGQTVVLRVSLEGQQSPSIFLARTVNAGGFQRLAYFEIAPDWLWKDLAGSMGATPIAVVDADGAVLQSTVPVLPETGRMFAHEIQSVSTARASASQSLSWQGAGEEWHGVLTHLSLVDERVTTVPWAVVALNREAPFFILSLGVWAVLPWCLGAALLVAWLGSLWISRRHVPAIRAVEEGLRSLSERRYERLSVAAADEARDLVRTFNNSVTIVEEQFRALQTLGEIDQLLLGSAELEQMLELILERVQTVTRCHSVGITLRDADAPGRGRIYMAANGLTGLPVSRVELDTDMVETLSTEKRGLTVTRCEEHRHSFLRPLNEIGSEFFWVWPVMPGGERVEAILAVGYREVPASDPLVAECGGQFAHRLAIALSKTARDERLHRQAHYDPLTSLPNRLLFLDRLNQELASATAGLGRGALLYIDLDHFKRVNDTVGHAAGDQLLIIVAQRLRSCVKDGDTVARLGGDEFTVILRNVVDPDAARSVAERIIESLQLPVNIGGKDHYVAASIGITLFPDDGHTLEELMRNADTAMYRAKELGRGRAMFFDLNMSTKPSAPTETGLHRALRRREFSLFYQPQFSVSDGSLAGVEALLRWQTPRDGVRYPSEFVPAAEESGLIIDIGGWVLDTACAQLAQWREQNIAPPRLALNVSAQQLKHSEFPKAVRRALDKYNLPPELLELELTESVFADEAAGAALVRLSQIGVHLALDDFGTGYSSLNYLRQYPIGTVKIDRAFLEEVPQNPQSSTLVETIVVMAHALGKRVVAEGIEVVEQLEFLRERHCDIAQGFYLARPLATTALTELLQARSQAGQPPSDIAHAS